MTTSSHEPTTAVIERVLAGRPDIVEHLAAAHDAAWDAVDRRLLELCRLRVAMLLGCAAELATRTPGAGVDQPTVEELSAWPTSPRFDERDRACLAFCEQFVLDVASMEDRLADDVRRVLGADGLVDLTSALLVIEQRQRMRLTWERIRPAQEESP